MAVIDFLLNLAGLLLWLKWRTQQLGGRGGLSLAVTLRRPGPARSRHWLLLAALAGMLVLRGVFYWQTGPAMDWTPQLSLAAIVLSFRGDLLGRMLGFSLLSFGLALGIFYAWLCVLAAVNWRAADSDLYQRQVAQHLGWVGRGPALVQWLLPFWVAGLLWLAGQALFVRWGMMPAPQSGWHLLQQAAVISLGLVLTWKYLFLGLFGLYLLHSYVYLGGAPFWNFIDGLGHQMLRPLRWFRVGRLDLAPVAGLALTFGLAELGARWLPRLYQRLPLRAPLASDNRPTDSAWM